MKRNVLPTLAAAAMSLAGSGSFSQAHAVSYLVSPGGSDLYGETGITYNGVVYDVLFERGSFNGTYANSSTSFTFTTQEDAAGASAALGAAGFERYLNGKGSVGDERPAEAYDIYTMNFITPYVQDAGLVFNETLVAAYDDRAGRLTYVVNPGVLSAEDGPPASVYVIWTAEAATSVPEPASLPLLAAGAAVLAASRKRRT